MKRANMQAAYVTNTFMTFWTSIVIFLLIIIVIKLTGIKIFKGALTKVAVFALVFNVMIIMSTVKLAMRFSMAENLIYCCDQYKQKYGEYPEKLVDIVPDFYNITLPPKPMPNKIDRFYYSQREGRHIIGFVSVGFLKTDYNFETRTWRSWD